MKNHSINSHDDANLLSIIAFSFRISKYKWSLLFMIYMLKIKLVKYNENSTELKSEDRN